MHQSFFSLRSRKGLNFKNHKSSFCARVARSKAFDVPITILHSMQSLLLQRRRRKKSSAFLTFCFAFRRKRFIFHTMHKSLVFWRTEKSPPKKFRVLFFFLQFSAKSSLFFGRNKCSLRSHSINCYGHLKVLNGFPIVHYCIFRKLCHASLPLLSRQQTFSSPIFLSYNTNSLTAQYSQPKIVYCNTLSVESTHIFPTVWG